MTCSVSFFPEIYLRKSPTDDRWLPRNKSHLVAKLLNTAVVPILSLTATEVLYTVSGGHGFVNGDLIEITYEDATYTNGDYFVKYVSQTTFEVSTTRGGTSQLWVSLKTASYTWAEPYTLYNQISVDGSSLAVTSTGQLDLASGGKADLINTVDIVIPNLETPITTWATWKVSFAKCCDFDVVLWDSHNNICVTLFDFAAQLNLQAEFSDVIRLILTGQYDKDFPSTWNKMIEFTAPLRMDGLMGLWEFTSGFMEFETDATTVEKLINRTWLADTDAIQTTTTNQPQISSTNGVQTALFDDTNDFLNVDVSGNTVFDISPDDFYIFGVGKVPAGGVTQHAFIGRGVVTDNTGWEIYIDMVAETLVFNFGNGTSQVAITIDYGGAGDSFYFIAYYRLSLTRIDMKSYTTTNGDASATGSSSLSTPSFSDDQDIRLGKSDSAGRLPADANLKSWGFGYGTLTGSGTQFTELQTYLQSIVDHMG